MKLFNETKHQIEESLRSLKNEIINSFEDVYPIWQQHSNPNGWNTKQISEHIYLVNQSTIYKIQHLSMLLLDGLVNNEIQYYESDFRVVDTMLNVCLYRIKSKEEFTKSLCYGPEEMKFKLVAQVNSLEKLFHQIPTDMVANYKEESRFISGMKLDVYQMIYLAIIHSQHHIAQISTLKTMEHALTPRAVQYAKVQS